MEAKVDIRKLQLLNDRINQTIEALNQVRLSVHGLSHTAGVPGIGYGAMGMGPQGFGPQAFGPQGFGAQGFGQPFAQQGLGGWGGMSHTGGYVQNPLLAQLLGVSPFGQNVGGFSHTSGVESMDPTRQIYAQWLLQQQLAQGMGGIGQGIDPYYPMRVQQTFPFAAYPVSPVG